MSGSSAPERAGAVGDGAGQPTILVAENDPQHRFVLRRVFRSLPFHGELRFVSDGQELLDYLLGAVQASDGARLPWPAMVLIDLHMPRMDGMEALSRMRREAALKALPVIMFSSSDQPHHIDQAYEAGANAYLVKVGDFRQLVNHLRGMAEFWLQAARLPRPPARSSDVSP